MNSGKFVTPEVNFLPEDDLIERQGGRFLKWALSWGKKIIVLTELLVVIAFLSRFKLDSDVANLSEEIDRRKIIIQASESFEREFRSVQSRTGKVKTITSLPSVVTIYDTAQMLIPKVVAIDQIGVAEKKLSLQGIGEDKNLSAMVADFKTSPDFAAVILEKVIKQGQNVGIEFSLTAEYTRKKQ